MRKLFVCVVLILCLTMTAALAQTVEEWNEGSHWRIASSAEVWNLPADGESGAAPVITLPAGTMVRVIADAGEWLMIDYYAGGSVRSGAVRGSRVVSADGVATAAPTASPTPIPLATAAPTKLVVTPAPTMEPNSMLHPVKETQTPAPTATPAAPFMVTRVTELGSEQMELVMLGSVNTVVKTNGNEQTVATSSIEEQIAVISAPKGGEATVRAEANTKAAALGKLTDGTLVVVIERGKGFVKVTNGSLTGYVIENTVVTDGVVMKQALGNGTLCTSSGKTTGKDPIRIRVNPKKSATQSYGWAVGSQVTVLLEENGWYLVEKDGSRGYVNKSFLKMNK